MGKYWVLDDLLKFSILKPTVKMYEIHIFYSDIIKQNTIRSRSSVKILKLKINK